jgi:2-methylisocitrate lyase-like PEP mutase family enzyme
LNDSPDRDRLDLVLDHFSEIARSVDVPVNGDFQDGYGSTLADLQTSVKLCIATGVSGFSIEDATGEKGNPLYDLSEAVDRIAASRSAIDESGEDVLLTARSECFLVGHSDPLNESIKRLNAYAEAGADVLFAPAPATKENVTAIVEAAGELPVNFIMSSNYGLTLADMAEMGVRRISVGSALARAAWTGFIRAAEKIANEGSFVGLDNLVSFADLNRFFTEAGNA